MNADESKKENIGSTSAATGNAANNTSSGQTGRVQIPVIFMEGNKTNVPGISNKVI